MHAFARAAEPACRPVVSGVTAAVARQQQEDEDVWACGSVTFLECAHTACAIQVRGLRPAVTGVLGSRAQEKQIRETEGVGRCDFCDVASTTAHEPWGRIETESTITCSNAFKAAGVHGIFIFKHHHPLKQSPRTLADAMLCVERWYARILRDQPERRSGDSKWVWPVRVSGREAGQERGRQRGRDGCFWWWPRRRRGWRKVGHACLRGRGS